MSRATFANESKRGSVIAIPSEAVSDHKPQNHVKMSGGTAPGSGGLGAPVKQFTVNIELEGSGLGVGDGSAAGSGEGSAGAG